MKNKMIRFTKTAMIALVFALCSACSGGGGAANNAFPNVDNASIPDVLETTVGTVGDAYFTSGISDNKEYQSYFKVTFENTTQADYDTLMKHYESESTDTDENGSLLFDWGWLQMTSENGLIVINAYIRD